MREHSSEFHHYIEPFVVAGDHRFGSLSTVDYVSKLEGGLEAIPDVTTPLFTAVDAFFRSGQQMLVLLGDAGIGKTTCIGQLIRRLFPTDYQFILRQPRSCAPATVFPILVPVHIELKRYKPSGLRGLLEKVLVDSRMPAAAVDLLRAQDPLLPVVRLVVFADGFDELQGDASDVRGFVNTICGGVLWPPHVLSVVVASRENRFDHRVHEAALFDCRGGYTRLLMLPFSKQRVRYPYSCTCVMVM
jgi:hypothetical protein